MLLDELSPPLSLLDKLKPTAPAPAPLLVVPALCEEELELAELDSL